ncbi:hypothetical protein [Sphingomonas bacterium]|uniref:hypothetical protein n=1 Tax=Sphingomonas bacterium TaxID=1895847 RepID=UPI00157709A4|nr:hypothetical protein [Sphingomonas bacterium]
MFDPIKPATTRMTRLRRCLVAAGMTACLGGALLGHTAAHAQASSLLENFGNIMTMNHLYSASDGQSHIEEMAVPEKLNGKLTTYFDEPVQKFTIGYWKDGDFRDFHYAGHKNLLIYLQGKLLVSTGDGVEHQLMPGTATLAEDWTGRGHTFRCVAPTGKRVCLFLQVTIADLDQAMPLRAPPTK